ncbi:MAG: DUF3098 domain-containing protein [Bacteroidetes bacterium]|nr:DUF3098 domain-containing protein [Bacteroidota bacterium]
MALVPNKKQEAPKSPSKPNDTGKVDFAFGRENYMLMLIGIAVIILGFILMAGGNPDDPTAFSPEIFSTRRITIAPIVVILGFGIEVAAIIYKSKE